MSNYHVLKFTGTANTHYLIAVVPANNLSSQFEHANKLQQFITFLPSLSFQYASKFRFLEAAYYTSLHRAEKLLKPKASINYKLLKQSTKRFEVWMLDAMEVFAVLAQFIISFRKSIRSFATSTSTSTPKFYRLMPSLLGACYMRNIAFLYLLN